MKNIIYLITALIVGMGADAQVYNNYKEAGKFASADMNYPLARYFFEEALRQIPEDSLYDKFAVNSLLMNANTYGCRYDEAIINCEDAIRNLEQLELSGSYYIQEDSLLCANIFALKGDSLRAARYLEEVFARMPALRLNQARVLQLSNLGGIISRRINDRARAKDLFGQSYRIMAGFSPCEETVRTMNLYGNALYYNDEYKEALKVYQEQLDVCESLYGTDSREYHWARYCVANMLAFSGRIDEGAEIYAGVIAWYRDKMLYDLQSMPLGEREKYLDNMIDILQNAISFGIKAQYNQDEFTALAYECLLLTKGLLLATEKSAETIIRENGTEKEIAMLTDLYQLKSRLSDLMSDPGSDSKEILNTYARIKAIDAELAGAYGRYGNLTSFASIGYEQIKEGLRDDEVLLDFADFKPKDKPRQYVCYEIRRGSRYPSVHHICNGAQLDSLLSLERYRWENLYSGEAGKEMASIIGGTLGTIIRDTPAVYYVPSGIFHKLAIEAIPDGEGRIGDCHSFRRLSSARELAERNDTISLSSAGLYGGLNYGRDVKPLKHSLPEVESISGTLSHVMRPCIHIADEGTKESFMQLSCNSPAIIHVSTHGFYYEPSDRNIPLSLKGYNDAMSLSGLVMSGGSLTSRLGLLTADEVAQCNLSGTSIACLASCHSAQGEVTAEGIYGLQRAFKKAGVQSVIMNLWEASDVATEYFMTTFYEDLINGSKDRHKAFRFAKDKVREHYPAPFYWAGFVMID